MNILTITSHSGHVGTPGVVVVMTGVVVVMTGVGVGMDVGQKSVLLCISHTLEHIIVRQIPDPMFSMLNITSPKSQKRR